MVAKLFDLSLLVLGLLVGIGYCRLMTILARIHSFGLEEYGKFWL